MKKIIHDKLFVARRLESKLSFMVPEEKENRKQTAVKWAGERREKHDSFTIDNVPTKGFSLKEVVRRWSTENKVVSIEDPRGFVVQVYMYDLFEMLQYVNLNKLDIEQECVWGFNNQKCVLIPVGTKMHDEYQQETTKQKAIAAVGNKKIPMKDLEINAVYNDKYLYLGRKNVRIHGKLKRNSTNLNDYYVCNYNFPDEIDIDLSFVNKLFVVDLTYNHLDLKNSHSFKIKTGDINNYSFEKDVKEIIKSNDSWVNGVGLFEILEQEIPLPYYLIGNYYDSEGIKLEITDYE